MEHVGGGKSAQGRRVQKASAGCIPHTLWECMECGQAGTVTLACGGIVACGRSHTQHME